MRIEIVSTYPPRQCGIATFSHDVRDSLRQASPDTVVELIAMTRPGDPGPLRPEVVDTIAQDERDDYARAASEVAARGTEVVLIEHEFGIFGGTDGEYITNFAEALEVPYVVTLHTVLPNPTQGQAEVLRRLLSRAARVLVMTPRARRILAETGIVAQELVAIVPHGAPAALLGDADGSAGRTRRRVERLTGRSISGRFVLATFGLISEGKGLEVAIEALPPVVEKHPEVLYIIAGGTHPEVVKFEGEAYRDMLERRVAELGLEENVVFVDRFLDDDELEVLLKATTIFVTPYHNPDQIVSGAVTFAVAAGCAIASTPYLYAEDLLSTGAGWLFDFANPAQLSQVLLRALDEPEVLAQARAEARRLGNRLGWPQVGTLALKVLSQAAHRRPARQVTHSSADHSAWPWEMLLRPAHLLDLTDDVGIIQHADGAIPARRTGYCVDDVARAVIVGTGLNDAWLTLEYGSMVVRGLSFLLDAVEPGVGMRNFMSYRREWLDDPHVGDHLGRAVWAMGGFIGSSRDEFMNAPVVRALEALAPVIEAVTSPRTEAFCLLGLTGAGDKLPDTLNRLVPVLGERLAQQRALSTSPGWPWFERYLTYDNARLPQALLAAGRRLGNDEWIEQALESLSWYARLCHADSSPLLTVTNRWLDAGSAGGDARQSGDEQPLDPAALVEALVDAHMAQLDGVRAAEGTDWSRWALTAYQWFLGFNRLGRPLYDSTTGACCDGIGVEALNTNQGAESTLAALQAGLALHRADITVPAVD